MPRSRPLLLALAFAALGVPCLARAQTCTFTTGPTALPFGAYDPASATPDDSTSTFVFNCTGRGSRLVLATVSLSAGAGTFTQRQMTLGVDRLNYNLYQDAARTIIWGDGTPPSQTRTNLVRRTTYTIYGRVAAGQWTAAGTYGDTITLTLLY